MNYKLSIITINYNNAVGLEKTIESVVSQTFTEYEYIIIDGASTDASIEVIKNHKKHIFYWISEPDSGVYNAMNKGIEKATGKYCMFLNSGDELSDENCISDLIDSADDEDIVFGNIKFNGNTINFSDKLTFYNLRWGYIPHPATIIKRSLFNSIGIYNESHKSASDWEFWIKAIVLNNCSYKHIPRIIAKIDSPGLSSLNNSEETILILT